MQHPLPHRPALDVSERVDDDECALVDFANDGADAADLEAGDHAVEDLALVAAVSAAGAIDGDAAAELSGDPAADEIALVGHDRDRHVLLDAMDDEVERARRGHVREDEGPDHVAAEHRHRDEKQDDVEAEDDVADLDHRAVPADQQRRDLRAVEDGGPAHRQTDACAEEEAPEHRIQHAIVGDDRKVNEGERQRQAADAEHAADREGRAELTVADDDEGEVDDGYEQRQRPSGDAGQQHRDAGHAAVDERARDQEAVQAETGAQDAGGDIRRAARFPGDCNHERYGMVDGK